MGQVVDEFLDMLEGMLLLPQLVLEDLDILLDLHHMMPEMVFQKLGTDKGIADLTCDQPLGALCEDMIGQIVHINELMACKTICLVMFIIHVLCQIRFQQINMTLGAQYELITPLVVLMDVLAHKSRPTPTINIVKRTIRKNMFGNLDMNILKPTTRHGAFAHGCILIHG